MFNRMSQALSKIIENDSVKLSRRKSRKVLAQRASHFIGLSTHEFHRDVTPPTAPVRRSSDDSFMEEDDDELIENHEKWENDYDGIINIIAWMVGLSNVWTFPFLCYTYGGVAFILPYFFFLFFCAYPTIYLELLVGQYAEVGAIAAFKLVPLFKGVGICMAVVAYLQGFGLLSEMAWCGIYLFECIFHNPLPWISCDNGFGKLQNGLDDKSQKSWTPHGFNDEMNWHTVNCSEFYADAGTDSPINRLPASEYFYGRVQRMWRSAYADKKEINYTKENGAEWYGLQVQITLEEFFYYNTDTFAALIFCLILILAFVLKGIKANEKFMALLVTTPCIFLITLFFRAAGLPGAWNGLKLLFSPKWEMLAKAETWWKASEQVIRSTGAGYGVHLTIASHNRYNRYILRDLSIALIVDTLTSFLAASVIFMFIGHVYTAVSSEILNAINEGPKLAFEVMPNMLGVLAKPNFYAACFFIMMLMLGITAETRSLICARTSLTEVLPVQIKYKTKSKLVIVGVSSLIFFLLASFNLTRCGVLVSAFIRKYLISVAATINTIMFLIAMAWFWGLHEIVRATQSMGIREPGLYFQLCWKYTCILSLIITLVCSAASEDTSISFDVHKIKLSNELVAFGYVLRILPMLAIIYGALLTLSSIRSYAKNFKHLLLIAVSPSKEHKDIIETGDGDRAKLSHYLYLYASSPGICNFFSGKPKLNQVVPEPEKIEVNQADELVDELTPEDIEHLHDHNNHPHVQINEYTENKKVA